MCSLTGSTIICCRSLFKLAVWCCPLPQPPRIIHCWCLNLPFQCWLSFNSYPRLCVSICYIVKLSIDILWCSFHGRAINQYNSIFCLCHCWLNWNCSNQFDTKLITIISVWHQRLGSYGHDYWTEFRGDGSALVCVVVRQNYSLSFLRMICHLSI